jgi:ribosomal protein S18 acetylase RimI-like enzyme
MAMERAVVSTTSGCAGLGLEDRRSVWIADEAQAFAEAVELLLGNDTLRRTLALEAKRHAEQHYGWPQLGQLQKRMWSELLSNRGEVRIRPGDLADLPAITRIQDQSEGASHWEPDSYFTFNVVVAERLGEVVGFMVSRSPANVETEVLNLAVAAEARRCGIATALLNTVADAEVFLEVRESNTRARQLYAKLGFKVVGRREGYYDDPVEAAIVMRKPPRKISA